MPQFKVTGPNGRQITLTGDQPPSELELDEIFGQLPEVEPQEAEPAGLFGRTMDVLGRVGGTLGRLGSGTAAVAQELVEGTPQEIPSALKSTFTPTGIGTWERNTSFDDVLGSAGYQEGWGRAGAGLVGDILIDPINLIPGAPVAKAFGKVAGPAFDAIKATAPVKALEKTFVQFPGLDKIQGKGQLNAQEALRLHGSTQRHIKEAAYEDAAKLFHDVAPDDATKMLHELDTTGMSTTLPAQGQAWAQAMDDAYKQKIHYRTLAPGQKQADYVPYWTKDPVGTDPSAVVGNPLKGTTRSDLPRQQFKSLADAVEHGGAMDNAQELYARYMTSHGRAMENNKFLITMAREFGSDAPTQGARKLANIKAGEVTNAVLDKKYFPKELADELDRAIILWEKPAELDNLWKTTTKLFKAAATSINPGHHMTNAVGNVSNMYVAGMPMKDIAQGIKKVYQNFPRRGGTTWGKGFDPKLIEAAKKYEIVGTASHLADLAEEGTSPIVNNPLFRKAREIGTRMAEEPSRLAMFDWLVNTKGMTYEKAALRVKDVLFDYAEITQAERKIRDYAVPFYTWMRKNIPLQAKAIVENPRAVERMSNVVDAPWNAHETATEQQVLPAQQIREGYVPSNAKGPNDELVMNRWALPFFDLNRMGDPGLLADSLNPYIKMALEGSTGRRLGTGQEIVQRDGLNNPSGLARLLSPLNNVLPPEMQGYVTPVQTPQGPQQRDIMAWLTSVIPTGVYGQAMGRTTGDFSTPQIPAAQEMAMRALGMTPDMITAQDSQREMQRRMGERIRQMMMEQAILEP